MFKIIHIGLFGSVYAAVVKIGDADLVSERLTCTTGQLPYTQAFTATDYDKVYDDVKAIYNKISAKCTGLDCPRNKFAGCTTRLAAHDFLDSQRDNPGASTKVPGTHHVGGMDGCIPLTTGDQAGLGDCITDHKLVDAYQPSCAKISLPDFLVIAAETVMSVVSSCEKSTKKAFKYNFRFGRRWCGATFSQTTAGDDAEIVNLQALWDLGGTSPSGPNANVGIEHSPVAFLDKNVISNLFYSVANPYNQPLENSNADAQACNPTLKQIGTLNADVVLGAALMGGHAIGIMSTIYSGYEGFWSDPFNASVLDNGVYTSILYKGFEPHEIKKDPTCIALLQPTGGTYPDCNNKQGRCPSHLPYCNKSSSKCEDGSTFITGDNLNLEDSFASSLCGGNKYTWARSDTGMTHDGKETMLNTDMVWAHNFDQMKAEEAKCCSYFTTKWLTDNLLDASQGCGTAEKCCKTHKTLNCNDIAVQGKINVGAAPSAATSESYGRITYSASTPLSSGVLKGVTAALTADTDLVGRKEGIALAAVIEFAKDEQKWLKYFHKAWYLASTSGQVGLKRINTVAVDVGSTASTECFSWGCEQFATTAAYYNEGHKNEITTTMLFNKCDDKYTDDACTPAETRTAKTVETLHKDASKADTGTGTGTGNTTANGSDTTNGSDAPADNTTGGGNDGVTKNIMMVLRMYLLNIFI